MTENELATLIVDKSLEVHRTFGPGLLEKVYQEALRKELINANINCRKEVELPVYYKGEFLECNYRLDLLVEDKVIVEVKSVQAITDVHLAQVLTYLKLSDVRLGLLINFNVSLMKYGIKRVVNGL